MRQMMLRNLKVYFRDKLSVFFSLLSVIITFMLYILFLGDIWTQGMGDTPDVRSMMDAWIMAGILSISSFTTTMGAAGTMVDDKTRKIYKDFEASPISRASLAGGYAMASFVVGVIMTVVGLVLAEVYIVLNGGALLSIGALFKMLGLIVLSVLSNTALLTFMMTFIKTNAAFGTASTLVGTLVGFLMGIYVPVGGLPVAVQSVVKALPFSHIAVVMRQVMMQPAIETVFAGAPQQAMDEVLQNFGVRFWVNGTPVSTLASILFLAGAGVLFFALSAWRMTKKKK